MRFPLYIFLVLAWVHTANLWAAAPEAVDFHLKKGQLELSSIGELAFGPGNILFIGDAKAGAVFAVEMAEAKKDDTTTEIQIADFDKKVAAVLGTTPEEIRFHDLAVHRPTQHVYVSVTRGSGKDAASVLIRADKSGSVTPIKLSDRPFAKYNLNKPIAADAKDRRGRPQRTQAISEMRYGKGKLLVAGLSNEEFASTLRQIPFPFSEKENMTSLEIFHVAHDALETHAPIRTFRETELDGKPHLVASYTCTPLVTFPMTTLKNGTHVKGKTVAELGAGNSPLDMVEYEWENKRYLLIANNRRGVMRIDMDDVANHKESLNKGVSGWESAGVPYVTIPFQGVEHLERLNQENIVVLMRRNGSGYNLDCGTRKVLMGIFN